jgi:hypothetical protein
MSPYTRRKVDTTQGPIVEALRAVGASVQSLAAIGKGCPDLLVGYRSRWYVLECKSPGGRLTEDEWAWVQRAKGPVELVWDVDGALEAIGAVVVATGEER